jgi:hypothetical protein
VLRRRIAIAVIVSFAAAGCNETNQRILAIRATTVVDVTDGSLRSDHTVLIAGNRIAELEWLVRSVYR